MIKHSSHLRTLGKCRKHSPAARAFYISLVFSNACRVLSQYKTRLRLLYLLIKIKKIAKKERRRFDDSSTSLSSQNMLVKFVLALSYSFFLNQFTVLRKCQNKFDCLVFEMLFVMNLKPNLNTQTDSIRAKLFV